MTTTTTTTTTIVPVRDPPPLLPIRGGIGGRSTLRIPRVGHSLYKTRPEDVGRCVGLALRCGVRHFDTATQYGSDAEARTAFGRYLDGGGKERKNGGSSRMTTDEETPELLRVLDDADSASRRQAERTMGYYRSTPPPNIDGSAGRRARREGLFVSHKLSNDEQSTDVASVKRKVREAISRLGVGYLDMVMIHSPLTDAGRRVGTYRALLELRDAGFVRSVGVCNYGIGPLEELRDLVGGGGSNAVDDLPALNQLEMSPFNAHVDVVRYCDAHGISIGCSAWSKLSGVDGPGEGWAVLSDLAKSKGMTKAQLLVRWSLQKGYVCVPRSGSSSKVERVAIAENSYGGVNPAAAAAVTDESDDGDATSSYRSFVLTDGEMKLLDGLDAGYKAGKLGRRDGWEDGDVVGPDWDPTDVV
jgi:diketogulonate reductase-like aldo/keto reductase